LPTLHTLADGRMRDQELCPFLEGLGGSSRRFWVVGGDEAAKPDQVGSGGGGPD